VNDERKTFRESCRFSAKTKNPSLRNKAASTRDGRSSADHGQRWPTDLSAASNRSPPAAGTRVLSRDPQHAMSARRPEPWPRTSLSWRVVVCGSLSPLLLATATNGQLGPTTHTQHKEIKKKYVHASCARPRVRFTPPPTPQTNKNKHKNKNKK
jgi:hypothetical protein